MQSRALRLIRQKKMTAGFVSLLIICAVLVVSYIRFCFAHPVVCTESFRYITPVLPAAGVFMGMTASELWKRIPVRILAAGVAAAFAFTVFMFYGSYAQYSPVWELLVRPS